MLSSSVVEHKNETYNLLSDKNSNDAGLVQEELGFRVPRDNNLEPTVHQDTHRYSGTYKRPIDSIANVSDLFPLSPLSSHLAVGSTVPTPDINDEYFTSASQCLKPCKSLGMSNNNGDNQVIFLSGYR